LTELSSCREATFFLKPQHDQKGCVPGTRDHVERTIFRPKLPKDPQSGRFTENTVWTTVV
jgi:hypothetical protein